ncbi:hypothetical protein JCM19239_7057 [Vibrio variabilis]|uniref:Outer membrane protein beta-barrel domain-containing protein n=1 Tax=Vibrio variabilis TaxID=990271 RepID=A0ABQ0JM23_9VIBR|nr:hypothetical protein JCM19239_7057 [Vibrio variabilis]
MKKLALAGLIAASVSTPVLAEKANRVGLMFTQVEADISVYGLELTHAAQGWGLEYGRQLNRVFGINLSYDNTRFVDGYDISNLKLGTDIGYEFQANETTVLKPYVEVGVNYASEFMGDNDIYRDFNHYCGIGLRAEMTSFYIDVSKTSSWITVANTPFDINYPQYVVSAGFTF